MQRTPLIIVLILFAGLSVPALLEHGYVEFFTLQLQTLAGTQVLVDLYLALTLVNIWIWQDAKASGRNPWPWIVFTLFMGAFGPLIYLLTRKAKPVL